MTAVRQTSRDAYEAVKASGVLSERLFETYEAVYLHPRSTRNELYRLLRHHNAEGTYGRALSLLMRAGVVRVPVDSVTQEDVSRICSVSGSKCLVYEVAPVAPSKDELKAALSVGKRPDRATLAKAVEELRDWVRWASQQQPPRKPSKELVEVAKWLRDLSP